jgi:penicillin amidase
MRTPTRTDLDAKDKDMTMARLWHWIAALCTAPLLGGCAVLTPLPEATTLDRRLAAFPTAGLPLKRPVTIHWNDRHVPFIEAADDEDLAFALGLVHAHLRLGQMTVLRRVAQGRIAESVGPLAADIDHSLRILNFGRGAAAFARAMPAETRRFVDAFVRGINHYQAALKERPHEFELLAIDPEPWTVEDVLTVGRLAGTDVNWLGYFGLLRLRERKDWPEIWARVLKTGGESLASFTPGDSTGNFRQLLTGASRAGSNALVVSGAKSASGAALMASDPHLGIQMPNLWLIAGLKSPSHHAVGFMIPGIPFIALGRNPDIAWGGTNMRAASSDLYDVSKLPAAEIRARTETIRVRWWRDRTITVRETPLGPVLSDAPVLNWGQRPPFALRWIGHEQGDEITAMLRAQRARNFQEYRAAFAGFAVSAQNMVYADRAGNIGQVMATLLPIRARPTPPDLILDPADPASRWQRIAGVMDLPASYNPRAGFLASANNKPTETPYPVGYAFSADDRTARMQDLMRRAGKVDAAELKRLQRDVYVRSSVQLRDAYLAQMRRLGLAEGARGEAKRLVDLMAAWDGHYTVESAGPVAFELLHNAFQRRFYERKYGKEHAEIVFGIATMSRLLLEDIAATDDATLKADLQAALAAAARRLGDFKRWGDMHRLGLAHPLAFAPVIGARYRFTDLPAGGSSESLMKTAHGSTDQRHFTRYGQQARFVSDLADLDHNWFVLLGGQDGWLGSSTALDQIALWETGGYVRLPLRLETVRAEFPRRMTLAPAR